MADALRDAFPSGRLDHPIDGAAFVGILAAEGPALPGAGPVVAAVAVFALEAGLDFSTTVSVVRSVRDRYAELVADHSISDGRFANVLAAHLVRAVGQALPVDTDMDALVDRAFPLCHRILTAYAANGDVPGPVVVAASSRG